MAKRPRLMLGVALFVVVIVAFGFMLIKWSAVDRCLAGGSYNYSESVCDFKESHPSHGKLASPAAIFAILGMGPGAGLITAATTKKHAL
jgi:hypothetical protein